MKLFKYFLFAIACSAFASAAPSMVAYYSFDGTMTDSTGLTTSTGTPGWGYTSNASCIIGSCGAFLENASTGNWSTNITALTTPLKDKTTFAFNWWSAEFGTFDDDMVWAQLNNTVTLGSRAQFGTYGGTSYVLRAETGSTVFSALNSNNLARHMWTIMSNSSGTFIYKDGALSNSTTGIRRMGTGNFSFGWNRVNANDMLTGVIDEWSAYNESLTATQVSCLYNGGTGTTYAQAAACVAVAVPENLSITARDVYDNTTISTFNATVTWNGTTTNYTTTTGQINTSAVTNSSLLANVTVWAANYFDNVTTGVSYTRLNATLKPYLYNASSVYRSDNIPIAGVQNFTPYWRAYVPTNTSVSLNFTCNAENATPSWTGNATNATLTNCPVPGSFFAYEITLQTTYNRTTPRVHNLTIDFVLGPFTVTAYDSTSSATLSTFNATVNGTLVQTTNGSATFASIPRGSAVPVTVAAAYYDSYTNASFNTSANLAAALSRTTPPDAANVSYTAGVSALNISWTNPDSWLVSGFRIYLDGVLNATLNGSTTTYAFTNLSSNTNYALIIEAFTPVGGANNYSFVAATLYNAPPVLTRVFPAEYNASVQENATTTFEVSVESPGGWDVLVEWFVDGVSTFWEWVTGGSGTSEFEFETGYQDEGVVNVTAVATDEIGDSNASSVVEWNVTVEDTYPVPAAPSAVLPVSGEYEYEIPLLCAIDYEPVRPAYFDFVYSINGGNYSDLNILTTDGLVVFDSALYDYGTNFSFGCRVNSSSGVSNYTYSDTFTRVDKNHFYLFEMGKNAQYNAMKPYSLGYVFEADNSINVTLYVGFADCNGDGVWDYTFDYREDNVTRARETFACLNARGTFETVVGMSLYKNNSVSWETIGCSGLAASEPVCAVYKSYEVVVQ